MKIRIKNGTETCPCSSNKTFNDCCKNILDKTKNATTAEALMRSRYTAFVLRDEHYLRYSWHPDYCPDEIRLNDKTTWLGLKIKSTVSGRTNDTDGQVEYIARSKNNGKARRLHENSRFTRYKGRWVYLDGHIFNP